MVSFLESFDEVHFPHFLGFLRKPAENVAFK